MKITIKFLSSLFAIFLSFHLSAQIVKEQYTIGGSSLDYGIRTYYTNDSGKLIIASSKSSDRDITNPKGGTDIFLIKLNKTNNIEWKTNVGTNWDDEFQNMFYSRSQQSYIISFTATKNDSLKKIISKVGVNGSLIWQNENAISSQKKYNTSSITKGFRKPMEVYIDSSDNIVVFNSKTDTLLTMIGIEMVKLSGVNGNPLISKLLPVNIAQHPYSPFANASNIQFDLCSYQYNKQNYLLCLSLSNINQVGQPDMRNLLLIVNNNLDTTRGIIVQNIVGSNFTGLQPHFLAKLSNNNIVLSENYNTVFLNQNLAFVKANKTTPSNETVTTSPAYYLVDSGFVEFKRDASPSLDTGKYRFSYTDYNGNVLSNKILHIGKIATSISSREEYYFSDVLQAGNNFMYTYKTQWDNSLQATFVDTIFKINKYGNILFKKQLDTLANYNSIVYNKLRKSCTGYYIKYLSDTTFSPYYNFYGYSLNPVPNKNTYLFADISYNYNSNAISTKYYEFNNPTFDPHKIIFFDKNSSNELIHCYNDFSISNQGDIYFTVYRSNSNTITGKIYFDVNNNNSYEAGTDYLFYQGRIVCTKSGNNSISYPNTNGVYVLSIDTGSYTTVFNAYNSYFNSTPVSRIISHNTYGNTDSVDFALHPKGNINDLRVNLVNTWVTRPSFTNTYEAVFTNEGTTLMNNIIVSVILDSRLTYNTAVPSPSSINGDTLKWNITSLTQSQQGKIKINFTGQASPVLNSGDALISKVWILPVAADSTPLDNNYILTDTAKSSYDPNDKNIESNSLLTPTQVNNGEFITYRIRFQNTGSYTATNIVIRDTLESNLDVSSLQIIAASHSGLQTTIMNGNIVEFRFSNINLPTASSNQTTSHGYLVFKIKTKKPLTAGTQVKNNAFIFFDYNSPVKTNTAIVKIIQLTDIFHDKNPEGELEVYPNPNSGQFSVLFTLKGSKNTQLDIYDISGNLMFSKSVTHNDKSINQVDEDVLPAGYYTIILRADSDTYVRKIIIVK